MDQCKAASTGQHRWKFHATTSDGNGWHQCEICGVEKSGDAKLASYLQQENEVLHAKVRQLEAEKEEHVWALTRALWNCRATAILEQEKPSGAHLTAFSLIQKYATEALGDKGLE